MKIHNNLKEERERLHISKSTFAHLIGCSLQLYTQIESGKVLYSKKIDVKALEKLTGKPIGEIIYFTE